MTGPAPRRLLTVSEAACIFHVAPSTVRTWLDRGHIERDTDGRIDADRLLDYLDERGSRGQHVRRNIDAGQVT